MKVPNQARVEDGESPESWVARLNKFFLQAISAFQSIKDSSEYVDIRVAGTANRIPVRRNSQVVDSLVLAKVVDVERPFDSVMVTGFHWLQDGSVVYAQIAGLVTGRMYNLRFLIQRKL